jgi:hypothetical protein
MSPIHQSHPLIQFSEVVEWNQISNSELDRQNYLQIKFIRVELSRALLSESLSGIERLNLE